MKFLPVLVHAISFIFRSGVKADLTSEDRDRSVTSKYQNFDVWCHWLMVNVFMRYKPCNTSVYIFHRALVIIYRCLTLTPEDSERSITSKYNILVPMNANWWLVLTQLLFGQHICTVKAAIQHVNPGQVPVLAADQPLFALANEIHV